MLEDCNVNVFCNHAVTQSSLFISSAIIIHYNEKNMQQMCFAINPCTSHMLSTLNNMYCFNMREYSLLPISFNSFHNFLSPLLVLRGEEIITNTCVSYTLCTTLTSFSIMKHYFFITDRECGDYSMCVDNISVWIK